jgi:predicted ester cyclase
MTTNENMRLMKMLDDAWNSQDWHTFRKLHTKNVAVYWPGQSKPTIGLHIHQKEAQMLFNAFPDNHIDNFPYLVLFGQAEWTCSIANFTGTHTGPMVGENGKTIPPTNKKFHIELCTVAHWKNGKINEEKLFYDLIELMRQLGWIQ